MLPNRGQLFKVSGARFAVLGQNASDRTMQPSLPQPLSLRPMRPTERAAIQRLGTRLFEPFGDYQSALHTWLRSPGVVTSVVSHPEEGLVGFTLLGLLKKNSGESQAYLLGIGVDPEWRGQGLGRLLLDSTLGEARKRSARWGINDLRLEVASSNRSARKLFERAGFAAIEPERDPPNYSTGDEALTMTRTLTRIEAASE